MEDVSNMVNGKWTAFI